MKKTRTQIMSTILALLMLCAVFSPAVFAKTETTVEGVDVTRLAGTSRIDTAVDISKEVSSIVGADEVKSVVIANGENYADALAGVPLAENLNAPILLTRSKTALEDTVRSEISRLGVETAYVLGGEFAISKNIENELKGMGLEVVRLAGQTRYDTAIAIAEYAIDKYSTPAEIFIVSGVNFPDALSVAPVAAIKDSIILFSPADGRVNDNTLDFISENSVLNNNNINKAYIIGGYTAIGEPADVLLENVGGATATRVYGTSRYDTAIAIYNKFNDVFSGSKVSFATGADFPDALTGAVLSAETKSPLFLVRNNGDNSALKAALAGKGVEAAYVYGGTSVVSDMSVKEIFGKKPVTTTTAATTTQEPTTSTATSTTTTTSTTGTGTTANNGYVFVYVNSTFASSGKIYSEPTIESDVITKLSSGASYPYLNETVNAIASEVTEYGPNQVGRYWYKISYNNRIGWVNSCWGHFVDRPITVSTTATTTTTTSATKWLYIESGGTIIYSEPSTSSTKLECFEEMRNYPYLGEIDGWYKFEYNGGVAWVEDWAGRIVDAPRTTTTRATTSTTTRPTVSKGAWANDTTVDAVIKELREYALSIGLEWMDDEWSIAFCGNTSYSLNKDTSAWGTTSSLSTKACYTSKEFMDEFKEIFEFFDGRYYAVNILVEKTSEDNYLLVSCWG